MIQKNPVPLSVYLCAQQIGFVRFPDIDFAPDDEERMRNYLIH